MKKYIPILLATSLLLSACSINFNTTNDNSFKKKQECEQYRKNVFQDLSWEFIDAWAVKNITWVYYSPKLQTCLFRLWLYKDVLVEGSYTDLINQSLYDYFWHKYIKITNDKGEELEYISNEDSAYLDKKIQELTWE